MQVHGPAHMFWKDIEPLPRIDLPVEPVRDPQIAWPGPIEEPVQEPLYLAPGQVHQAIGRDHLHWGQQEGRAIAGIRHSAPHLLPSLRRRSEAPCG